MKVKDLVKYLTQAGVSKNATVWLGTEKSYFDFTCINSDDRGDIVLDRCADDKEA